MNKFNCLCAALLIFIAPCSQATVFSSGAVTSNDASEIFTDTLNGLEWLRLDLLADLNYAETLAEIASGGGHAGQGWNIAHNAQALLLVNALFHPASHACNVTDNFYCGTTGYTTYADLLGNNDIPEREVGWFLSDNGSNQEVGYLDFKTNGDVWQINECTPLLNLTSGPRPRRVALGVLVGFCIERYPNPACSTYSASACLASGSIDAEGPHKTIQTATLI